MKWPVAIVVACFFAVVLPSCATSDSQRGAIAQADPAPIARLIMRQLYRCWTPPVGPPAGDTDVSATVAFSLNRDGSLAGGPTLVKTSTGPKSQAVADSALRAVRRCTPLKLPADKYEVWREVEATFDPRRMCDDIQHCRPLAVEGPARTEFIRSAHDQCIKVAKDQGNYVFLTSSQLEFYCACVGTTVADAITGAELANDASIKEKGKSAAPACMQKVFAHD